MKLNIVTLFGHVTTSTITAYSCRTMQTNTFGKKSITRISNCWNN